VGEGTLQRVLLIDDMISVRALLKVYLMEFGFAFSEASNGQEGLQLARAEKPDLVIVDLVMPVMGGIEFLDALRRDPVISQTPVIILTGSAAEVSKLGVSQKPHTQVTRKPVEPAELKRIVREALHLT
jgi:CheY-like chemotaxis protein